MRFWIVSSHRFREPLPTHIDIACQCVGGIDWLRGRGDAVFFGPPFDCFKRNVYSILTQFRLIIRKCPVCIIVVFEDPNFVILLMSLGASLFLFCRTLLRVCIDTGFTAITIECRLGKPRQREVLL